MTVPLTRRGLFYGAGAALFASLPAGGNAASTARGAAATPFIPKLADLAAALERRTGGRIGLAVLDVGTGRLARHRAGERFPMCSTFKLLACAALLDRVDAGQDSLDRRIRFNAAELDAWSPVTRERAGGDGMTLADLCEAAMTRSDNTAANLILASLGGPAAVTAYARRLKDEVTRLDRTEPTLNEATPGDLRDTTTPEAMAANLRVLIFGEALSPAATTRLVTWLRASTTGNAKLRAGLPRNWIVGDKTGSGGHGTANDVAVLWPPRAGPLIVSVYMTETTGSAETCDAAFASIARAIATAR